MAELETQNQEQTTEGEGLSPTEVRESSFFRKMIKEKDSALNKALSELQSLKAKQEEEIRAKEIAEQEAKGNYDQVIAKLKAEKEHIEAKYQTDITTMKLENALARAGADEYFTTWAISKFEGGDVNEYVNALKADEVHSSRFNMNQQAAPEIINPIPSSAVPASRAPSSWTQVKADLTSGDPAKARAAGKALQDYYVEHGQMPPG